MILIVAIFTLSFAFQSSKTQSDLSSEATIANGIEVTGIDLSKISDEVSKNIYTIDSNIEASTAELSSAFNSILLSRILELQEELDDINSQINELTEEMSLLTLKCQEFSNCLSCTTNSNCVWCNSGFCTEGDKKGPYHNECSSFIYDDKCPKVSCSSYDACSSCVNALCG